MLSRELRGEIIILYSYTYLFRLLFVVFGLCVVSVVVLAKKFDLKYCKCYIVCLPSILLLRCFENTTLVVIMFREQTKALQ